MNSSFAPEGESTDITAEPIKPAESADPAPEYLIGITKPEETEDCCAVLLRGGKSRRMGRDKALLSWKKSTFLETIAAELEFLDEKYLSVSASGSDCNPASPSVSASGSDSNPDRLSEEWHRLPDLIPDCGPLGGIYTALQTCEADWALVVSCDIPAIKRRLFAMMLKERADNVDIIYPVTPDGRMHMTCALYRKSIAPTLKQQIDKGDNRLRVLKDLCRARAIPVEDPALLGMLSNINTGEDYAEIHRNLKKR